MAHDSGLRGYLALSLAVVCVCALLFLRVLRLWLRAYRRASPVLQVHAAFIHTGRRYVLDLKWYQA
jgi:hypothetical protein